MLLDQGGERFGCDGVQTLERSCEVDCFAGQRLSYTAFSTRRLCAKRGQACDESVEIGGTQRNAATRFGEGPALMSRRLSTLALDRGALPRASQNDSYAPFRRHSQRLCVDA